MASRRAKDPFVPSDGDATRRIACISVPALPLALVLRRHPDWCRDPLVVVESDHPLAEILWANEVAAHLRVVRGLRFNQAQAVVSRLRAAVVPAEEVDAAIDELLRVLTSLSPRVEPSRACPGVFWADASGMQRLCGSLERWARDVELALVQRGFTPCVVIGFERHGTFALARSRKGVCVLESAEEERRAAHRVELAALDFPPKLVSQLAVLGVRTVGEFLRLPARDLRLRYGEEAHHLHQLASNASWAPLAPERPFERWRAELDVEPPSADSTSLLFLIKTALSDLAEELAARSEAVTAIDLHFRLERAPACHERIETASPTRDLVQILELVQLRLAAMVLLGPVERAIVEVSTLSVLPEQRELIADAPRRDLDAANRAIARIRAAFGPASVVRARLIERHLPEARFAWEPVLNARFPLPRVVAGALPLVRRIQATPVSLPPIPAHEPESWLGTHGAVLAMHGPHRLSGGWWKKRVERDYFYVETRTGEILWLFYDRQRRRWFLHGVVD